MIPIRSSSSCCEQSVFCTAFHTASSRTSFRLIVTDDQPTDNKRKHDDKQCLPVQTCYIFSKRLFQLCICCSYGTLLEQVKRRLGYFKLLQPTSSFHRKTLKTQHVDLIKTKRLNHHNCAVRLFERQLWIPSSQ